MKQYLDPLFFLCLFVIDVVVWVSTRLFGPVPSAVIIMAPAFISLALFALVRAYFNVEPKRFYLFVGGAAAVFSLSLAVTEMLTPVMENYDFSTGAWVLVVCALGAIVALFLAFVGAIPGPDKVNADRQAAQQVRADQKAQTKAQRQAEKAARKAGNQADRTVEQTVQFNQKQQN